jgi:hypothetical protein
MTKKLENLLSSTLILESDRNGVSHSWSHGSFLSLGWCCMWAEGQVSKGSVVSFRAALI